MKKIRKIRLIFDIENDFENQNCALFDLKNKKRIKGLEFCYTHQFGAEANLIHCVHDKSNNVWF